WLKKCLKRGTKFSPNLYTSTENKIIQLTSIILQMKNDQFEDINYDIVSNAKQILNFAESQYLQTGQLEPLSEQVASQLAKLTLKQFYKALDELQLSTPVIENVFSQIRNNKNITPDEPEELI